MSRKYSTIDNKKARLAPGFLEVGKKIQLSVLLGLCAYNHALISFANSTWVNNGDTDLFGNNPTELELLWFVRRQNFYVLTDWHYPDELRIA